MSKHQQEVRLFLEEFERDGLQYMDCPECGKAGKLMIGPADEGGHWYKCLSAGCATFGTTESTSLRPPTPSLKINRRSTYKPYQEEPMFRANDVDTLHKLRQKYDSRLSIAHAQKLCAGTTPGRWIFPVVRPTGTTRGYVARAMGSDTPHKTLLRPYVDTDEPMQSWYIPERQGTVMAVVEDQPSAVRLASYMPTVALLGTSVSQSGVDEIQDYCTRNGIDTVYVILDNDAADQVIPLARKFNGRGTPVPMFGPDIKDMSEYQFAELIGVLT